MSFAFIHCPAGDLHRKSAERGEAPPYLAGQLDVRGFGGFALGLSRVADPPSQ
jgi:hypothetical protein